MPDARDWRLWSVLIALVALLGFAWWWRHRRTPPAAATDTPAAPGVPALSLAAALRAGDPAAVICALASDAGLATEDLDVLCERLADPEQVDALRQLQAARWGGGDLQAARQAVRLAFAGGARWRQGKRQAHSPLPPLYPD